MKKETSSTLQEHLADKVLGEGKYQVLDTMKGAALEYIEYEQLMPFVKADKNFLCHLHGLRVHRRRYGNRSYGSCFR